MSRRRELTWLIALAALAPLLRLLQASGVADGALFETRFLPWPSTWENYRIALLEHDGARILASATLIAICVTVIVVACAAAAAYSLARLRRGPATQLTLATFAAAAFVPPVALLPPLRATGLDIGASAAALFLPCVATTLPLAVLLLVVFFRQLPPHLEAAARIDGARWTDFFLDVLLPLSASTLTAVSALVFLLCWGQLLFALPAGGVAPGTLAAAAVLAHPPGATQWGEANALAILASLPPLATVLLFSRPLLDGVRAMLAAISGEQQVSRR